MIAPRWRKVVRDATTHLPRTLLVAVAIATSLAGAGSILTSWALVRRATQEGYLAANPAAATLHIDVPDKVHGTADSALLARVRAVPGVREAQWRRTISRPVFVQGSWRPALLFATDAPQAHRIGVLRGAGGQWPPTEGTIAIERSSLEVAGTFVGDTLTFATGATETRQAAVTALVRDVSLAPGWMEHVVYLWASAATLAQLGFETTPNELQLTVTDVHATRVDVRRVALAVRRVLDAAAVTVLDVDVPEPGEHIHAAQMDSLLVTQGAFGVLALLVGAFLVVNLMTAVLAQQGREIGVMKVLGGDHMQLTAMYMVFALGTGVVATTLALPFTLILGRRYAALRAEMLNFDVAPYAIPWWSIAMVVAVGLLLPMAAAWFPVRRATRQTVAESLRDVGLVHDGGARDEPRLARVGGWSRVWVLSMRNAFRQRQRVALTMLTIAGGGSVFVAAGNLRRAVGDSMDLIFGSQHYTFSLRLAEPHDADSLVSAVRGVEGVRAAESWTGARGTLEHDGLQETSFSIVGVPDDTRLLALDIEHGAAFATDGSRSLVVSRSLQRLDARLVPGAQVEIAVSGRRATWTVAGTFEGGPAPVAYTSAAALAKARSDVRRGSVMVATDYPGVATQVDLIQRVRAALASAGMVVASSQLVEEQRRVTEDHLLMVVQFLTVMGWVMIVVGGMGLASTMGLAVLERTREIGVMRAIGARHGTLVTLIEGEGLVIALLGWAIAIPISLPMSAALAEAFSRIMLRVPIYWVPDWRSVLQWLGVVMVTAVVACAWPALRATRVTVSRALTYE